MPAFGSSKNLPEKIDMLTKNECEQFIEQQGSNLLVFASAFPDGDHVLTITDKSKTVSKRGRGIMFLSAKEKALFLFGFPEIWTDVQPGDQIRIKVENGFMTGANLVSKTEPEV